MRISRLLLVTTLFMLLGNFSFAARAADGNIKLTSIAQIEVEVTGKDGKKTLKREPVAKAVPGTEVIFTTTFENISNKPADNIIINNPVPNDTEYKGGSAYGAGCEIVFSADHGKHFAKAESLKIKSTDGKERAALPKEYTDIRWTCKGPLAGGKSGEVGFHSVIK